MLLDKPVLQPTTTRGHRCRWIGAPKVAGSSSVSHPLRSRIRTRKTDQRLDWQRGAGTFLRHVLQHLDLVFSTVGHTGYELSDQILRQCSDEEIEVHSRQSRASALGRCMAFSSSPLTVPTWFWRVTSHSAEPSRRSMALITRRRHRRCCRLPSAGGPIVALRSSTSSRWSRKSSLRW